jgi:hypothetical protein
MILIFIFFCFILFLLVISFEYMLSDLNQVLKIRTQLGIRMYENEIKSIMIMLLKGVNQNKIMLFVLSYCFQDDYLYCFF